MAPSSVVVTSRSVMALLLLSVLLSACAYVKFSRLYEIGGVTNVENVESFVDFFVDYYGRKGLILTHRYNVLSPTDTKHLVFELPRTREEKRRNPSLLVAVESSGTITLEQNEWFLSVNPIRSMEPYIPDNFIESTRSDLESELRAKYGPQITIRFLSKSYY